MAAGMTLIPKRLPLHFGVLYLCLEVYGLFSGCVRAMVVTTLLFKSVGFGVGRLIILEAVVVCNRYHVEE